MGTKTENDLINRILSDLNVVGNGEDAEVEDFADAILAGRAPQFSLVETLRNAEVMDNLFAAAGA